MSAEEVLQKLVEALDSAFISSWQSTAYWDGELEEAKEFLAGIPQNEIMWEDRNGAMRNHPIQCQRFGANGVPEAVYVNGKRYILSEEA